MSEVIPATPLHRRARDTYDSRVIRGFTTFAPPSARSLLDVAGGETGLLVAVNAEKYANTNPSLQAIANANLAYPDGMGAVLALRRLGARAKRIAGADLWLGIVDRYAAERRFYIIGATGEVIQDVARRLRRQYPAIDLRFRDGYLQPGDQERLYDEFRAQKPEIVVVGMGSPHQEILMSRFYAKHPALYIGVGGSFDVYIGRKPRAPKLLQGIGLEWAYQFVRTPSRLHRLPAYLKFGMLLALGRIR